MKSHLQAPLLVLLLFPPLQWLLPLKSWTSQCHPWRWKSTSSKLLLMSIFWSLPMNHEYSQWHLEWWILSRRFQLTLLQSIRGISIYGSYSPIKCISQIIRLKSLGYSLILGLQNECCVSRPENSITLIVHLPQSSWFTRYIASEQSYFERNLFSEHQVSTVGLKYSVSYAVNGSAIIQALFLHL